MRKHLLAVAIAVALGGVSVNASATGIPVVDVAGIAQMVLDAAQQAQQAMDQLKAAQEQIDQAKSQFDETKGLITGNSGYGSMYNNANLTDYMPTTTTSGSWSQVYEKMQGGSLDSLRNKFGLQSDDPVQQEVYDKKLTDYSVAEAQYRANNLRLENLTALQAAADSASTPQEKEDISNRIKIEQASIANETNRQQTMKDLAEKQQVLLAQKQNIDFNTFLTKGE